VSDIIVVKGDPSPAELAALAVALLAVATSGAGTAEHQPSRHRRPPAVGHERAVVSECGCG
jgi:hypothetical protein